MSNPSDARELPEIQADLKTFFNDAPLEDVLNFIRTFDNLGAGEIVRKVLIVWVDAAELPLTPETET